MSNPPPLIAQLQELRLLEPDVSLEGVRVDLRALCDAGALVGGVGIALDLRPDELIGPLCARLGGRASKLKVLDVREERRGLELTIFFEGATERWDAEDPRALVAWLNDFFRKEPKVKAVAVLGEWEDMLQLWCVP